jgi:photosystem II stability/assembly factor-like uncharacterized protein
MNTTNGRGLRGALSATALCLGLAAGAFADDPPSWTWSGWGGGGFFWSAVFDPSNADVIYMGGDVVGLYKTTDRGANWRFINRGLHEYGVYSLAVSKSDPKVLYAMTPNGMARSANGGEDWQALPETLKAAQNLSTHRPGSVRAIAVDPTTADTVYAGSGTGSLCKSTDGGQTWTALDYLAAVKKDAPAASAIAAASGAGFAWLNYESAGGDWKPHGRVEKYLNNGEDWSAFNRLTARAYAPAGAPKLTAQLVLQSGGDWAWQQGTEAVLKPGEWTEVALDLSTLKGLDAARMAHVVVRSAGVAWQGELGLDAVTLHPADAAHPPRVIGDWEKPGALDGWRLSTAKDAPFVRGFRTSAEPPPNVKAPIGAVAVAESDPRRIFVAHRQLGIFRSVDAGTTWTHMDTPRAAAHVTVFPSDAQFVFGAFGTNGVWKSSDGGATWASAAGNLPAKCEAREVVVDPRDPQVLHLIGREGWNGQFFSTRDGGATWTSSKRFQRDFVANPTLPAETGSGEFATGIGGLSTPSNLALSPSEPDVLFIAANWNNVLSTDSGRTWNERVRGADITCFHDLRFVGNRIYAAAMDEGLLMSEDDGATWKQLAPLKYSPGTSGHQWRVAAWPKEDGTHHIVSTVSPWQAAEVYPNGVLVSDDGGATFSRGQGLPTYLPRANTMWGQGYARALAADPKNPSVLYLGIDGDAEPAKGLSGGGVFKSTDGGLNWTQLPNQPGSRRMFYGLAVDPTDSNRIFWGACGDKGGVWRSEDAGASWERRGGTDPWIFNLEVAPSGNVYAGGNNLWRSTDHGATWKQISKLAGRTVVGLAIDPEDEQRIWISGVTWGGSDAGGVFRTTDGGATWQEITGDLPYKKPLILRYNPATRDLWAAGVGAFKTKQ